MNMTFVPILEAAIVDEKPFDSMAVIQAMSSNLNMAGADMLRLVVWPSLAYFADQSMKGEQASPMVLAVTLKKAYGNLIHNPMYNS
jgi:Cu/Ag efflux pump CusA